MNGVRRPSMRHVARLAGVSVQTVSRVINHPAAVAEPTRTAVRRAIEFLGYSPNSAARALRQDRTYKIGVVMRGKSILGPNRSLPWLDETARGLGYGVTLSAVLHDDPDSVGDAFDALVKQGVDGIIVAAPQSWPIEIGRRLASRLPVVLMTSAPDSDPDLTRVAIDQRDGVRQILGHLAQTGHKTVAHVSGPLDWADARQRLVAWREETHRLGLVATTFVEGTFEPPSGYGAVAEILADGRPDAIFAANDFMAIGVMRAIVDAGLRVPDDISVVGFDDMLGSAYLMPSLTTVRQPMEELGARAAQAIGHLIDGGEPTIELIRPLLVVRESVRVSSGSYG